MKKILALVFATIMVLSLAACGGGSSSGSSNRDATFELSNEEVTCILEYDSSICEQFVYESEDIKDFAYVNSEAGAALLHLIQGSASAEQYIETFKDAKLAGNYSDYYVKDLVVEELHSCEVNGYTYKTYSYSYKDVYVSQGHEYENSGILGYIQLTDDAAILIEDELYYEDWATFAESILYVKEVKTK